MHKRADEKRREVRDRWSWAIFFLEKSILQYFTLITNSLTAKKINNILCSLKLEEILQEQIPKLLKLSTETEA